MMASTVNTGGWGHAIPLDETTGFPPPSRSATPRSLDSRQSGHNDPRSSTRRRPSDYPSDSEAAGSRRPSVKASSATATRKRSNNTLREKRSGTMGIPKREESQWIHRDKLAQIEIQEMEDAGIHVRQSRSSMGAEGDGRGIPSRSMSRSKTTRASSSQDQYDSMGGDEQYGYGAARKRISTIPAEEEEEYTNYSYNNQGMDSGVHTPEEQEQTYRRHGSRPSTSKIPLSMGGGVPVPQNMVDRDSPLTRNRTGSNAGGWDDQQFARRARTNSVGSQVLFDDADGMDSPQRMDNSPNKENYSPNKVRGAKPLSSSGRKASTTSAAGRSTSATRKPSTTKPWQASSSVKSRPPTRDQHGPEGEAPWIATMYKPDPRLPPDQQMLPTHAKRMMQEQWEKDGKIGTTYDREGRLLNDDEIQAPVKTPPPLNLIGMNSSNSNLNANMGDSAEPAWPLTPRSENRSDTNSARPSTSGGYKITPRINTPPQQQGQLNPMSPNGTNNGMFIQHPPSRMSDFDDDDEKDGKKKLCCCTMM